MDKSNFMRTFALEMKIHGRRVNLCIGTEAMKREDVVGKG